MVLFEGLTPRNAILTLNKYLGENTAVCTDVGQHQMWSAQNLNFRTSRRFVSSGGLGTMGFGTGAAIGAAFGTKERSVLVTGDGSFGMTLQELATAVTYNVPIVILIMNNGVLGMVRQWQTLFYGQTAQHPRGLHSEPDQPGLRVIHRGTQPTCHACLHH